MRGKYQLSGKGHNEKPPNCKPAGILVGFKTEDDWFDYRLENDPRFIERIASARQSLREKKGIRIEDVTE